MCEGGSCDVSEEVYFLVGRESLGNRAATMLSFTVPLTVIGVELAASVSVGGMSIS